MNVNFWGPSGWKFLHTLTFNYPINPTINQKKIYKNYFTLTGDILPCKYCRVSYKEFIKKIPIDNYLDSRDSLVKWFYLIHNLVNKKLNKRKILLKTLIKRYEKYRVNKCKHNTCQ